MPILSWAESTPLEEYKRALWIALGAARRPQARAVLRRELEQLNDVSEGEGETTVGVRWGREDGVGCQASASPGADRPCPQNAGWCLTLGQLEHVHVCAEHAVRLIHGGEPYFYVRRIEDCSERRHNVAASLPERARHVW